MPDVAFRPIVYSLRPIACYTRRGDRVAEGDGLENRCALVVPGVRIPPSPPFLLTAKMAENRKSTRVDF